MPSSLTGTAVFFTVPGGIGYFDAVQGYDLQVYPASEAQVVNALIILIGRLSPRILDNHI